VTAQEQGFDVIDSVLSQSDCDFITSSLPISRRAGTRDLMAHPVVRELAFDTRLLDLAKAVLGPSAVPFRATLFAKTEGTNWLIPWHQDTALPLVEQFDNPDWTSWSTKAGIHYAHAPSWALSRVVALRVHLDPSLSDNGPLRVIPESHRTGVLSDREVLDYVQEHPATTCITDRGGILAMRPLLIHASSKSETETPRRVLHIEYADDLNLKPGIRLAIT
jgi:ectoine hydroxylase-related dioxygenase (phytanoyl-CoA dioxygenase family)